MESVTGFTPAKLFKVVIAFLILCMLINVGGALYLVYAANDSVEQSLREVVYPVAAEGCLPEGEVLEFQVNKDGAWQSVQNVMNLKTTYTNSFKEKLSSSDNLLSLYLTYPNNSITVTNDLAGTTAYNYASAANRNEPLTVTVTAALKIPLIFYLYWKGPGLPGIDLTVTKKMTVYSEKYIKED